MKSLYFFLFLIPFYGFSQELEDKLQGTWISVGILDSAGRRSAGEFGRSNNYLKFLLEGKKLFISLAPFDKGSDNRIVFRDDYFELVGNAFKQKRYQITGLADENLILETMSPYNRKIFYHFVNASKYFKDLDQVSNYRVYEKIILETVFVKAAFGYNLSSYYLIDNSILNLLPGPQFEADQSFSFGYYIGANLNLPLPALKGLDGRKTAVEFDVTEHGLENIVIERNLGDNVDFALFDVIQGTNKKWKPLVVDGKVIETRVKLMISFIYREE